MQRNLISSYISALAISILLLFASVPTFAQSKVKKVIAQADTIPLLRGVAISVDALEQDRCCLATTVSMKQPCAST